MPKLTRNIFKGRGAKAPALRARPKALLKAFLGRLGRSSGGYVFLSAWVVAAVVAVVSLLTFLAPDSDRPFIGRPVQAVQSMLPGVLEQVEGGVAQAAMLLSADQESVQNVRMNLREGLAAARSGYSGAPTTTSAPPEEPSTASSFPATDEAPPPPQMASGPSAPSSGGGTDEASTPAPPPATEAPPPTTSEPTSPPATEEPSPPLPPPPPAAAEEPPAPPKDEPAPPTEEEPAAPPPVTD